MTRLFFTQQKRFVLSWSVTAYVIFITGWLILRGVFFDQLWPLALLNTIAEYLFVLLPLLFVLVIYQRHWALLLGLSLPTLAFAILFGELFLPSLSSVENNHRQTITVMSFNVLFSNKAYGAIADSVRAASPDLIGFQELRRANAREIINLLETEYAYHALESKEDLSVGLLSRYPIETAEQFPLPPLDLALHTTVNINGEGVHVFVVHLSANQFFDNPASQFVSLVIERYGRRAAEVTRLEEEVANLTEPTLLMCDCNLTDTSEAYVRLDTFLNDSFREAGWGFGHTFHPLSAPFPLQRIDYVWHSDDFVATEAFVGQEGHSDHLPVVAKLRLTSVGQAVSLSGHCAN
jgi:vancomycin resistance protein VanJ